MKQGVTKVRRRQIERQKNQMPWRRTLALGLEGGDNINQEKRHSR